MASLVVYLDPARLGPREAGATWAIDRDAIGDLTYLDERGSLFVVTVEHGRAWVVAVHEGVVELGSEARVFDHDITRIVCRLGCESVDALRTWTTPRVLTPSDAVLLRYTLGLPVDDADEPAIGALVHGDPLAEQLCAAVWDDPASDDPRTVYADYLHGKGDPRGELISLQLARARDGGAITTREIRLLRLHALDCVGALRPYLEPEVELARGFLARCATRREVAIPDAIVRDPAWSTVDELATTHLALARSPRLRARRLGTGGGELAALARGDDPPPFEEIVGWSRLGEPQRGVRLERADWAAVLPRGALANLRALAIDLDASEGCAIERIVQSPLANGLDQLDVFARITPDQATALRTAFDRAEVPLLTIRSWLPPHTDVCIALARTEHGTRLAIQLDDPLDEPRARALVRRIAPLSTGMRRIVVEDLEDPIAIAERQQVLLALLRPLFKEVVARPIAAERLAL